jgi:hypothetical protein
MLNNVHIHNTNNAGFKCKDFMPSSTRNLKKYYNYFVVNNLITILKTSIFCHFLAIFECRITFLIWRQGAIIFIREE